jgi:hypothetical protein
VRKLSYREADVLKVMSFFPPSVFGIEIVWFSITKSDCNLNPFLHPHPTDFEAHTHKVKPACEVCD